MRSDARGRRLGDDEIHRLALLQAASRGRLLGDDDLLGAALLVHAHDASEPEGLPLQRQLRLPPAEAREAGHAALGRARADHDLQAAAAAQRTARRRRLFEDAATWNGRVRAGARGLDLQAEFREAGLRRVQREIAHVRRGDDGAAVHQPRHHLEVQRQRAPAGRPPPGRRRAPGTSRPSRRDPHAAGPRRHSRAAKKPSVPVSCGSQARRLRPSSPGAGARSGRAASSASTTSSFSCGSREQVA